MCITSTIRTQITQTSHEIAEHETAKRNYDQAIAKLAPLVADAYQRLQASQAELLTLHDIESRLIGGCMDPQILERESELQSLRMELMQKRSPLVDDLRHAQAVLSTYRGGLDYVEHYEKKDDIKVESQNIEYKESIIHQLSNAIAEIDSELKPIDVELAKLQMQKLVP